MNLFAKSTPKLKIVINDIYVAPEDIAESLTDIVKLKTDGDFFYLKLENRFTFKIGHLKAFSFPDNFREKDFIDSYYIDADLAEVFKTASEANEISTVVRNYKVVYISQVFIEQKHRSKGLGTYLVEEFHKLLKQLYPNQPVAIVLTASPLGKNAAKETTIHESTAKLTKFYRGLGYSDIRGSIVKYIKL